MEKQIYVFRRVGVVEFIIGGYVLEYTAALDVLFVLLSQLCKNVAGDIKKVMLQYYKCLEAVATPILDEVFRKSKSVVNYKLCSKLYFVIRYYSDISLKKCRKILF